MKYYQIENGVVVGWVSGTDIPGDPSSTKSRMDAWVSENPAARQIKTDNAGISAPATHLRIDGKGNISLKSKKEIDDHLKLVEDAKTAKDIASQKFVADIKAKLMSGTMLTREEADYFVEGKI